MIYIICKCGYKNNPICERNCLMCGDNLEHAIKYNGSDKYLHKILFPIINKYSWYKPITINYYNGYTDIIHVIFGFCDDDINLNGISTKLFNKGVYVHNIVFNCKERESRISEMFLKIYDKSKLK